MSVLSNFTMSFLSHRQALLNLLEVVEDQHLDFKPWEKGMSFSELVLHTVGSTKMFVDTVEKGAFSPPTGSPTISSVAELRNIVNNLTVQTKQQLETLSADQLNQLIPFNGMNLPGLAMLDLAKDHEIHHKGQLFTYARLQGIEQVPFFVHRS